MTLSMWYHHQVIDKIQRKTFLLSSSSILLMRQTYLSCLVLIFCSSCLFLPFSSESCFFSASSLLSHLSSVATSFCRALSFSLMSCNVDSQSSPEQGFEVKVSFGSSKPKQIPFRKAETSQTIKHTFNCCSSCRLASASTVMVRYWEGCTAELLVLILLE